MDWHEILGIASSVIWIASAVPYMFSIIRGQTRPSFISYFLWATLGIIDVAAQWSAGASWSILGVAAVTFNTGVFAVLAGIGYGYKKYSKIDGACLVLAIGALLAWYLTNNPVSALLFSLIANFLAAVPTFIKTYREPHSELAWGWVLVTFAAILGVASNTLWTPANLIMPVYMVVECGIIASIAFFGQRRKA
jgi:hypothetical protein